MLSCAGGATRVGSRSELLEPGSQVPGFDVDYGGIPQTFLLDEVRGRNEQYRPQRHHLPARPGGL